MTAVFPAEMESFHFRKSFYSLIYLSRVSLKLYTLLSFGYNSAPLNVLGFNVAFYVFFNAVTAGKLG